MDHWKRTRVLGTRFGMYRVLLSINTPCNLLRRRFNTQELHSEGFRFTNHEKSTSKIPEHSYSSQHHTFASSVLDTASTDQDLAQSH